MSIPHVNSIPPHLDTADTGPPVLDDISLETVIVSFLQLHPTPSDEHVHSFAESLGLDYQVLEDKVYEMLGVAMTDSGQSPETVTEEMEPQDPLDTFILTFFMFNTKPNDAQIHNLASIVGVGREELEERIYRMLAEYQKTENKNVDTNLGESADAMRLNWEGSPETTPMAKTSQGETNV